MFERIASDEHATLLDVQGRVTLGVAGRIDGDRVSGDVERLAVSEGGDFGHVLRLKSSIPDGILGQT